MSATFGWKRLHKAPRRVFHGATLASLTPRGRYLLARSEERYSRRDDAYGLDSPPLTGKIGNIESFRIVIAPTIKL